MNCSACKGPFHTATGHVHSEKTRICGSCAREMVKFVKRQMSRRFKGEKFYDHVETSRRKT